MKFFQGKVLIVLLFIHRYKFTNSFRNCKSLLLCPAVTLAVTHAAQPDPLEDQLQLRPGQGNLSIATIWPGTFKRSFLQPFMKYTEPVTFPYQQLYLIGTP